jgi:hypothetical protein
MQFHTLKNSINQLLNFHFDFDCPTSKAPNQFVTLDFKNPIKST